MRLIYLLLILSMLGGCASVAQRVADAQPYSAQIKWPEKYAPKDASFYVHNKIVIAAPPEKVWQVLIQAEIWPSWYQGAFDVDVLENTTGVLQSGSVFTWNTMGLDFTSKITEFEKPHRLSWVSERSFIKGYHAWLLVPHGDSTLLVTDESQHGVLAVLQGVFQPNKLRDLHDIWLAKIKEKSENSSND